MEKTDISRQETEKKPNSRRSQSAKVGRLKYILQKLNVIEEKLDRVDRRTRMQAAGLRGLYMLGEDYVSMVACKDDIDVAILVAIRDAGAVGRHSTELADGLDIDYRRVSERIQRMNKRMIAEIGEPIIERHGLKWVLIAKLRKDFEAKAETIEEEKPENPDGDW